jgi:homoserine O-acetyltransferase/O-succinyltransferase
MKSTDANDMLYQYESSHDYNPSADLGKITAPVTLMNVYDDFLNPGELESSAREMKKVRNGKFVLLPSTDETRGHYTYFVASVWEKYFRERPTSQ